ncbi:nuoD1, partial [Symbiodinium sp. KB8]
GMIEYVDMDFHEDMELKIRMIDLCQELFSWLQMENRITLDQEIKDILASEIKDLEITVRENSTPEALVVPADKLIEVMSFLHQDARCYFDMLSCLTGVDLGEEANTMEMIYHLNSIPKGMSLAIIVQVNREAPNVPSVMDIWRTADWHEREAYDLLGIHFEGHSDLRRILLPNDWEGHPLRKDYKEQEYYHGMKPDRREAPNKLTLKQVQYEYHPDHLKNSEPLKYSEDDLKSGEMIINMGPQHPSTHGVLRLEIVTDGEIVHEVVPHLGYLHRCFEKHAESMPYNQVIPYVDRMDYVAAMNNEHAYVMGVERMLGMEGQIPKRIEYIRVLVAELNRIASHFVAIGTYGLDIGAMTPFFWVMRDREHIMRLLEWTCGARMLYNYIWVGGLFYDLPVGFEEKCTEFINYLKPKLDNLQDLLISNQIFIDRTANIGVLPMYLAINYGVTGPMLRGSGLKYDLRRVDGYSVYPELDFDIPIGTGEAGTTGDCWDRTWLSRNVMISDLVAIVGSLDLVMGEVDR